MGLNAYVQKKNIHKIMCVCMHVYYIKICVEICMSLRIPVRMQPYITDKTACVYVILCTCKFVSVHSCMSAIEYIYVCVQI